MTIATSRNATLSMILLIATVVVLPKEIKSEKTMKIGPCVNYLCPAGYDCIKNECIKNLTLIQNLIKGKSIGPCINGLCPEDHTCYNDFCYSTNKSANVS